MTERNGEKIKLHERVTRVETEMCDVKKNVEAIVNNHLPHIKSDIEELQKVIWKGLGALAAL